MAESIWGLEVRDHRTPGHWWADNALFEHLEQIKYSGFVLYCYLCRCASNDTQQTFRSLNTLSRELGMSKTTITEALARLEGVGLIHKEQRLRENGADSSNVYTLLNLSATPKGRVQKLEGGVQNLDTGGPKSGHASLSINTYSINTPGADAPGEEKPKGHPVKELLTEIDRLSGWEHPDGGKQARYAKLLLAKFSQEDILACYRVLLSTRTNPPDLYDVWRCIAAWKAGRLKGGTRNGPQRATVPGSTAADLAQRGQSRKEFQERVLRGEV